MITPTFARHECDKCTLIGSTNDIIIPREVLKKVNCEPIFVGLFTKLGQPGHSYFFIFKCNSCGEIVIDYVRGYTRDGGTLFVEHFGCSAATEINGMRITRWPLDEINIKELEEGIKYGKYNR